MAKISWKKLEAALREQHATDKEIHAAKNMHFSEGCEDTVYQDTKGIPTLGCGRNMQRRVKPNVIAQMLLNDIATVQLGLARLFDQTWDEWGANELTPAEKMVLEDLLFNLGAPSLKKFRKFLALARELATQRGFDATNQQTLAAMELLDSTYARIDVPRRAIRNALTFATGDVQWLSDRSRPYYRAAAGGGSGVREVSKDLVAMIKWLEVDNCILKERKRARKYPEHYFSSASSAKCRMFELFTEQKNQTVD